MPIDHLSKTLSALADPTRRAILARLAAGEATVNQLAEPFAMSQPAISRHLKVLEQAGLITRSRDAQARPAKLQAKPMRDVAGWIERYRRHWEHEFANLDRYLATVQTKEKKSHARKAR